MTRTTTIRTALLALCVTATAAMTGCDPPLDLRFDAEELEAFLGDGDEDDAEASGAGEDADARPSAELDLEAADADAASYEPRRSTSA